MALETAAYIDGLVASNPAATDGLGQADDHIRLIKSTITTTFAEIAGPVTADHNELNILDGALVTTDEVNYLSGVTSAIQTQIDTKSPSADPVFTGAVTAGDKIVLGSWEIWDDGGYLYFKYGTNNVFRMDSDGHFRAEDDISAFNTV
jgi:hypothetical protein